MILPQITATIPAGSSLSNAIDLSPYRYQGGYKANALIVPSNWTSATIAFQVSSDNVNFYPLFDGQGNEYTNVATPSTALLLDPAVFNSYAYLKIQSGSSTAPVNQASAINLMVNIG